MANTRINQPRIIRAMGRTQRAKVISRIMPTTPDGEIEKIDAGLTEMNTHFTQPDGQTHEILAANGWQKIRMRLETAGPVAIGTRLSIVPVLSGRGRLLPVGVEIEFDLKKGDRLYIAALAVNRVSIVNQRVAYGDRIVDRIDQVAASVKAASHALISLLAPESPQAAAGKPVPKGFVISKGVRDALRTRKIPRTRMRRV